ncbi:MAG: hypothetical protein IJ774_06945 [Selenomonadaceae bacterium]|nr:hypothetical protein [Selenomonadaceae bacterium]
MKRGVGLVGVREDQTFAGRLPRLPIFIGGMNGLLNRGGRMLRCSTKIFASTVNSAASVVPAKIIIANAEIVVKSLAAFFVRSSLQNGEKRKAGFD